MLRRIMLIFAGLLLAVPPAHAQEATGYWQGTLAISPAVDLRLGLAISRDEAGALTGMADSPDQSAYDIPVEALVATGGRLAFSIPSVRARFEGRWNAELAAWEGTFFQGGQAWPLVLGAALPPTRTAPEALPEAWDIPGSDVIGDLLDSRIEGRAGAGVVVGVLESGSARYVASGPEGGQEGGADFGPDTLFEIGSMTKVFTALLLADMHRSGEVSLDDPVARYLPEGARVPTRGGREITLRMLSAHTSGLPRLPDNMPFTNPADPYADYSEALLLEFLAGYELPRDPGAEFEYSNLGAGLLGYVLGRVGGDGYAALVDERILTPLGMADTAIVLMPMQEARFATGHDEFMRPAAPWNLGVLAGAGGIRSTARDMLRFLSAVSDPATPLGQASNLALSDARGPAGGPQTALGWMLLHPPSGEVVHHGGGTGGFRTHMAIQRTSERAVVVLVNASVEPSAEDLALNLLAGVPLSPTAPVPPAPPEMARATSATLSTAELDHVAGRYRLAPGIEMAVVRVDGGLTAQITGQPALAIYPETQLAFAWRAVEARVIFAEDEDGTITGAVLHQNGAQIPLTRIADPEN